MHFNCLWTMEYGGLIVVFKFQKKSNTTYIPAKPALFCKYLILKLMNDVTNCVTINLHVIVSDTALWTYGLVTRCPV